MVKIKLSLCFNKHHAMKTYSGSGGIAPRIFDLVTRILENRVLRRICGHKRENVTGRWRRLYNEESHNLHALSNMVEVIKLRRMKWAGHVA
jgi:hypothetical protein